MKLNEELLKRQNVSKESEAELEILYDNLYNLLTYPKDYDDPVAQIEELEFEAQRLWNLPQDRNYHRYWKAIDGCRCPVSDNEDPMYFGRRITVEDCPWHWSK